MHAKAAGLSFSAAALGSKNKRAHPQLAARRAAALPSTIRWHAASGMLEGEVAPSRSTSTPGFRTYMYDS